MNLDFTDKTVIITGGTRGIGAAIAQVFLKAGAQLLVTGTKDGNPKIQGLSDNNNIRYHQLDFSSDDSVNKFLDTVQKLKKIDVLINNAGVNKIESISNISSKDWDWINTINLKGPFLLTPIYLA